MLRTSKRNFRMAGFIQRHQCPSVTGCMFLLAIALLCPGRITANESSNSSMAAKDETEMTTSADTTTTNGTLTNQTTSSFSTQVFTTNAAPSETPPTNLTPTSITTRMTSTSSNDIDGKTTTSSPGPEKQDNNDESPTEKIGSIAIAGLCLVIVALLLIAVNGYVLFKSKIGSCTSCSSKQGMFHVLQLTSTKKDRGNDDDVEDNFEEDADVDRKSNSSTSLTKESPADQPAEQNGEVHVKVDVEDIAESSKNKTDDKDADKGATAAAAADVVDKSNEQEDEVEKRNETVVTVTIEGGNGNKNEP